jgi:hypothetical protein
VAKLRATPIKYYTTIIYCTDTTIDKNKLQTLVELSYPNVFTFNTNNLINIDVDFNITYIKPHHLLDPAILSKCVIIYSYDTELYCDMVDQFRHSVDTFSCDTMYKYVYAEK